MRRVALAVMIVVLTASRVSVAQQPTTDFSKGNGLLKVCSSDRTVDSDICLGYIVGAADGLDLMNDQVKKKCNRSRSFCYPSGVAFGQIRDVVINYLKANPDKRQDDSALLVELAMNQAWPCSE
jgi:hypothetical protein